MTIEDARLYRSPNHETLVATGGWVGNGIGGCTGRSGQCSGEEETKSTILDIHADTNWGNNRRGRGKKEIKESGGERGSECEKIATMTSSERTWKCPDGPKMRPSVH